MAPPLMYTFPLLGLVLSRRFDCPAPDRRYRGVCRVFRGGISIYDYRVALEAAMCLVRESGRRESDPHLLLGRQWLYH